MGLKFSHGVLKGRRVEEVAAELAHGSLVAVDLPMVVVKFKDASLTTGPRAECLFVLFALLCFVVCCVPCALRDFLSFCIIVLC